MYSKAANEKECFINKLFIAKSLFFNVGKKGDLNIL
jgi:L-ribulose-5-phosphate 3-epimerase UlaE